MSSAVIRPKATPPRTLARRVPMRATHLPANFMATMAPAATMNIASDSDASDNPKRAFTVGIWMPQVANVAPLAKQTAMVAARAERGRRWPRKTPAGWTSSEDMETTGRLRCGSIGRKDAMLPRPPDGCVAMRRCRRKPG